MRCIIPNIYSHYAGNFLFLIRPAYVRARSSQNPLCLASYAARASVASSILQIKRHHFGNLAASYTMMDVL